MSIFRQQGEFFIIWQSYQKIFFPDLLVSFLSENKGQGFTHSLSLQADGLDNSYRRFSARGT